MTRIGAVMRRMILGSGLALTLGTVAPGADPAQSTPTVYYKSRAFKIPFKIDPEDRAKLKEVRLYVSSDRGRHLDLGGQTTPDYPYFSYRAPRDGEYWFGIRTIDVRGRPNPTDAIAFEPNLKVIVDTAAPAVKLVPLSRRGVGASVRWEVSDANLDPALPSLALEYRVEGADDWKAVPIRRGRIGLARWDAGTAEALEVRLSVADRAGNVGERVEVLPDGTGSDDPGGLGEPPDLSSSPIAPISTGPAPLPALDPDSVAAAPAAGTPDPDPDPATRSAPSRAEPGPDEFDPARSATPRADPGGGGPLVVGSTRFPLQYSVEGAGPEGPAIVELWVTRDGGRSWSRLGEDADRASPFPVELGGEGLFGLRITARSASGLGDERPRPGTPPEVSVEVDTTPPKVQIGAPRVNSGNRAGTVTITWRATDAHLSGRNVFISYRPDGPNTLWEPIAGPLENTGRHDWKVPRNVAPRFRLRVDVLDSVGNRGSAASGPITLDRSRPRGHIIGVDARARAATDVLPR